jgi:hypothetical protein
LLVFLSAKSDGTWEYFISKDNETAKMPLPEEIFMNKNAVLLTILFIGIACIGLIEAQQKECNGCDTYINKILIQYYSIKIGVSTRGDIEKLLDLDGGVNMRTPARYVFKECRSIKVNIEFEDNKSSKPNKNELMPKSDIVKGLSKPYLDAQIVD